jgi:hypothetical protein
MRSSASSNSVSSTTSLASSRDDEGALSADDWRRIYASFGVQSVDTSAASGSAQAGVVARQILHVAVSTTSLALLTADGILPTRSRVRASRSDRAYRAGVALCVVRLRNAACDVINVKNGYQLSFAINVSCVLVCVLLTLPVQDLRIVKNETAHAAAATDVNANIVLVRPIKSADSSTAGADVAVVSGMYTTGALCRPRSRRRGFDPIESSAGLVTDDIAS